MQMGCRASIKTQRWSRLTLGKKHFLVWNTRQLGFRTQGTVNTKYHTVFPTWFLFFRTMNKINVKIYVLKWDDNKTVSFYVQIVLIPLAVVTAKSCYSYPNYIQTSVT